MNDIPTTIYIIIIMFGQDTLLIIGTINYWNLNRNMIYGKYMVVEKEGFGVFKNNKINMLLFSLLLLKHRLCNISLYTRSKRRMFVEILIK